MIAKPTSLHRFRNVTRTAWEAVFRTQFLNQYVYATRDARRIALVEAPARSADKQNGCVQIWIYGLENLQIFYNSTDCEYKRHLRKRWNGTCAQTEGKSLDTVRGYRGVISCLESLINFSRHLRVILTDYSFYYTVCVSSCKIQNIILFAQRCTSLKSWSSSPTRLSTCTRVELPFRERTWREFAKWND